MNSVSRKLFFPLKAKEMATRGTCHSVLLSLTQVWFDLGPISERYKEAPQRLWSFLVIVISCCPKSWLVFSRSFSLHSLTLNVLLEVEYIVIIYTVVYINNMIIYRTDKGRTYLYYFMRPLVSDLRNKKETRNSEKTPRYVREAKRARFTWVGHSSQVFPRHRMSPLVEAEIMLNGQLNTNISSSCVLYRSSWFIAFLFHASFQDDIFLTPTLQMDFCWYTSCRVGSQPSNQLSLVSQGQLRCCLRRLLTWLCPKENRGFAGLFKKAIQQRKSNWRGEVEIIS